MQSHAAVEIKINTCWGHSSQPEKGRLATVQFKYLGVLFRKEGKKGGSERYCQRCGCFSSLFWSLYISSIHCTTSGVACTINIRSPAQHAQKCIGASSWSCQDNRLVPSFSLEEPCCCCPLLQEGASFFIGADCQDHTCYANSTTPHETLAKVN